MSWIKDKKNMDCEEMKLLLLFPFFATSNMSTKNIKDIEEIHEMKFRNTITISEYATKYVKNLSDEQLQKLVADGVKEHGRICIEMPNDILSEYIGLKENDRILWIKKFFVTDSISVRNENLEAFRGYVENEKSLVIGRLFVSEPQRKLEITFDSESTHEEIISKIRNIENSSERMTVTGVILIFEPLN